MFVDIEDLLKNINEDSILDNLRYDLVNYYEAYDLSDDDFFHVNYRSYEWNDLNSINPNYDMYMDYSKHYDYGLLCYDNHHRDDLCRNLDSMSIPYIIGDSIEDYYVDSINQYTEVEAYWVIIDKVIWWLCGKLDMLGMVGKGFKEWEYLPMKDDECHLEYNIDFLSNIINGDWEDYYEVDIGFLTKHITDSSWETIIELYELNCGYLAKLNNLYSKC